MAVVGMGTRAARTPGHTRGTHSWAHTQHALQTSNPNPYFSFHSESQTPTPHPYRAFMGAYHCHTGQKKHPKPSPHTMQGIPLTPTHRAKTLPPHTHHHAGHSPDPLAAPHVPISGTSGCSSGSSCEQQATQQHPCSSSPVHTCAEGWRGCGGRQWGGRGGGACCCGVSRAKAAPREPPLIPAPGPGAHAQISM